MKRRKKRGQEKMCFAKENDYYVQIIFVYMYYDVIAMQIIITSTSNKLI